MIDYKNCKCSVCHQPLGEHDDIVVCPECGAPYHRACFERVGACVYKDRHGAAFSFADTEEGGKSRSVVCPSCGAHNGPDNIFCERCGAALRPVRRTQGAGPGAGYRPPAPGPGAGGHGPFAAADPLGSYQFAAEYDGIATKDWAAYIGQSASYYLYQFDRMDARGRKTSVCWSALLFAPMYFCYRRMWGWGFLALAASLLFSVPSFLAMFQALGMPIGNIISPAALNTLGNVCWVLQWAVSVAFSLFAFYLYRRSAARKILSLRDASAGEAEFQAQLQRRGGPAVWGVVLMVGILFAVSTAVTLYIGPDRLLSATNLFMTL